MIRVRIRRNDSPRASKPIARRADWGAGLGEWKAWAQPLIAWTALVLLVGPSAGCCCFDRLYCPSDCATGAEPMVGPGPGGCASCGGGCDFRTTANYHLSCRTGCGEVYWGEWISNPPDECDPCNNCGNFVGPRCCPPRFWDCLCRGFCGLWGGRYGAQGDCCLCGGTDVGCSSCGGHGDVIMGDGMVPPGEVIPHGLPTPAMGSPKPAPQPQPAPKTQARRTHPSARPVAPAMSMPRSRTSPVRPAGGTQPARRGAI